MVERHGTRFAAVKQISDTRQSPGIIVWHTCLSFAFFLSLCSVFRLDVSGPDVQYADRNDMQRIFSAVVKNSLFDWGEYEEQGADAAPTCRRVS